MKRLTLLDESEISGFQKKLAHVLYMQLDSLHVELMEL